MTLWESDIGKLEEDKSYKLFGLMVREFRGEKYLSAKKENSSIEVIEDIGDVEELEEDEITGATHSGCKEFEDVHVVAVERLDNYKGCMKCGSKVVVDLENEELGMCSKCELLQCIEDCKTVLTAQIMINNKVGNISLRVFEKNIFNIAQQSSDITAKVLLKAKPFNVIYKNGIICAVSCKV